MRRRARMPHIIGVIALLVAATTLPAQAATSSWTIDPRSFVSAANVDRAGEAIVLGGDPTSPLSGERAGIAEFAPHEMRTPVSRITATRTAPGVEIDVRGRGPHGWTQWYQVPVTLPVPTTVFQPRIVLTTDSPQSQPITLTASSASDSPHTSARSVREPVDYTVYATREGLVGARTASGHVITVADHFVALPSRRALSIGDNADYRVRVCAGQRCVTEPVLDVGPWNTHDDYWNTDRELFDDLPLGKPEAEAAYTDSYHDGMDFRGRQVLNPAGIDLADGTFADLGLTGSNWVTVHYDWTD